jgi:serine/threonine protein kinase
MISKDAIPSNSSIVSGASSRRQSGATTQTTLGQLGQYDLLLKLGEGGMGEVYKARHRLMDRVVALKVINRATFDKPLAVERFQREIRALAKLSHPNIVPALYAEQAGESQFLVMEYVAGPNLQDLVQQRGPLAVAEACSYIRQTAQGLQHAHEHGLVHRDIKPSNLLVTPEGQIKILDFGLALVRGDLTRGDDLTAAGQVMGSFDYMAPEQWDDAHAVDIRADVYSLGCTLYYLLAGQPPFGGARFSTPTSKMKAHSTIALPTVRDSRPEIPHALEPILSKMTAKNLNDRFATPAEIVVALEPFAGGFTPHGQGAAVLETRFGPLCADATMDRARSVTQIPEGPYTASKTVNSSKGLGIRGSITFLAVLVIAAVASVSVSRWYASATANSADWLEVRRFEIHHHVIKDQKEYVVGLLNASSFSGNFHVGDSLRLWAEFGEPADFYLISLNTSGEEVLRLPSSEWETPATLKEFQFPEIGEAGLPLDKGAGVQVFVLIASREPLPSFKQWEDRVGQVPWMPTLFTDAWYFDGSDIAPVNGPHVSDETGRQVPPMLKNLADFLKDLPDGVTTCFLAFPIEEKLEKGKK